MSHTQIEILGARERRRRWSIDRKLKIIAETEEVGASVLAVAALHDVYPGLLHTWRRQARRGQLVAEPALRLLPVRVAGMPPAMAEAISPASSTATPGRIEITLPNGCRVRVGNDVTLSTLRPVISVLRG